MQEQNNKIKQNQLQHQVPDLDKGWNRRLVLRFGCADVTHHEIAVGRQEVPLPLVETVSVGTRQLEESLCADPRLGHRAFVLRGDGEPAEGAADRQGVAESRCKFEGLRGALAARLGPSDESVQAGLLQEDGEALSRRSPSLGRGAHRVQNGRGIVGPAKPQERIRRRESVREAAPRGQTDGRQSRQNAERPWSESHGSPRGGGQTSQGGSRPGETSMDSIQFPAQGGTAVRKAAAPTEGRVGSSDDLSRPRAGPEVARPTRISHDRRQAEPKTPIPPTMPPSSSG